MAYWYTGSAFFQIPQSYYILKAVPVLVVVILYVRLEKY